MVSQRDSNNALLDRLGLTGTAGPVTQPLPDTFIAQWPRQTVLRLSGADARKFLQGQLTCQLDQLTETDALYGAACTPKGKAIANFRLVLLDNGDILLRVSTELTEQVLQHFQKYLVFFKAKLEPADGWAVLGVCGAGAHQALGLAENGSSGKVTPWYRSRAVASLPDAQGHPRSELWLNGSDFAHLEATLASRPDAASSASSAHPPSSSLSATQGAWLATEIQAGLTVIDRPLSEHLVPQYFNWHAVEGINFKKGCYTGQEIIARLRYLGQLKKSTYRLSLPNGGASALSRITTEDGRQVGEVTNLIDYTDGRQEALAVLNHQAASERLVVDKSPASTVEIAPLPYRMAEQDTATAQPDG